MSTLETIYEKLQKLGMLVCYGSAPYSELAEEERLAKGWNYIVFYRDRIERSRSEHSRAEFYRVAVVREGAIPESYDDDVRAVMEEIPGMKLAGDSVSFDRVLKGSSGISVEVMAMMFRKSEKR